MVVYDQNYTYWTDYYGYISVQVSYVLTLDDYDYMERRAHEIVSAITYPGMSDLDKEKAIHDYICTNTKYDHSFVDDGRNLSGSAYSTIVHGTGVCEAYSEEMATVCRIASVPCIIVNSPIFDEHHNGEGHSWNLVYIDGYYRHLDVTWDDNDDRSPPDTGWFNLSDKQLAIKRSWIRGDYPPAPEEFVYNDDIQMIADGLQEELVYYDDMLMVTDGLPEH